MNGAPFKLGTFAKSDGKPFAAIVLGETAVALEKDKPGATSVSSLTALPPIASPGKMFYAAQNFQEHVDEMIRAGMSPKEGPKFTGEKSTTAPYLFLKAPSCLAGAHDDIP